MRKASLLLRLTLLAVLLLAPAACNLFAGGPTEASPPAQLTATLPAVPTLKPPDSDTPAAGICGRSADEIAVIRLNDPPPPDPRCLQVSAGQRLKILNTSPISIRVALAGFEAELPPGGEALFDKAVGEYLAPGVHQMLNGAEVWLVE